MVLKTLGLRHHFRTLRDPRRVNCCQHLLLDVIAICAVIANADDWQGVETFGHDRIDNSLHSQLDVTFGEDANREQGRIAGQNLAWVRRLALSLLKQHPSKKSMAQKRLSAAYNTGFLEEILAPHGTLGKS